MTIRAERVPAVVLLLWAVSTLAWWAFAFVPLPTTPPEWLAAARAACFGPIESGLPALHGWMLLVLAPASFLVAIVALWGADLQTSLRGAARSQAGRLVLGAVVAAALTEGGWVATKLHAAQAVVRFDPARRDLPERLPGDYPRRATPAPEFALVDQHGAWITRSALRGRPLVVSFVFAHCTTICPLIVESIKQAAPETVGAEVLLVTLDPWRDTVSALPGLARRWALSANMHVLSSTRVDDVVRVTAAFEVPVQRNEATGDVAHPALVFLIDAEGRIAYVFDNPPPAWIREGLRRLG